MSDPPISTVPWSSTVCTEHNWSNSNAIAVLFALAVGCLAHPRGSLTFNKSGRTWRLSPHFGIVEALHISTKLLLSLKKDYSLHTACVTILAIRTGNSWTSVEHDVFQQAWLKAQESNSDGNQGSLGSERLTSAEEPLEGELVIAPVGRSSTIDAEEGRANLRVHRLPNTRQDQVGSSQNATMTIDEPRRSSSDSLFLVHLKEAEQYERGLTFRLLVWIPMFLALVKILSVHGGWHIWGPKICGLIFFVSWLTVELTTIIAARACLSSKQRDQALRLSRGWRKSWEPNEAGNKTVEWALFGANELILEREREGPSFLLGRICSILLLGFNTWTLLATTSPVYFRPFWRYFRWTAGLTGLWSTAGQHKSVIKASLVALKDLFVFYIPICLPFLPYASAYFVLVYYVVTPRGMGLIYLFLGSLASRCRIHERTVESWNIVLKVADLDGLVPGYLAIFQAILTVLRYTRVLNDYASYDCSTTTRASWYDWTL